MAKFHHKGYRPLLVSSDNARITANTVEQCNQLVGVAKKLSETAPLELKAGPLSIKAGTVAQALIEVGILIGMAWFWKSLGRKRGNDGEIVAHTLPEPEPAKMESLNETIGKNTDSLKEMRVIGDLIRYGALT